MHTARRSAYSLADELGSIRMLLQQVNSRIECVPVKQVTPEQFRAADYLVLFCPQDSPALPPGFLHSIAAASQPVLWVGYGAEQLTELPPFRGQFQIPEVNGGLPADTVNYRGRSWKVRVDPWIVATRPSNSTAQVLMSVPAGPDNASESHPLCWKSGPVTVLANVPLQGPMAYLFTDLLWDFYGAREVPDPQVFLRIEDYHARSDHRAFRRMVDYLHSRRHSFMVGVIPAWRDPATGQVYPLATQPDFVAALRYAQERGGRLLQHGYFHAHGNEPGKDTSFGTWT